MQRARRHVLDIRLGDIVGLNLVQHFLVYAHLPVDCVALRAGIDAAGDESTEKDNNDEGNRDAEEGVVKTSGHKLFEAGMDHRLTRSYRTRAGGSG